MERMKKKIIIFICLTLSTGCFAGEFNKVFKSTDTNVQYEYAKQFFAQGKFGQAVSLLEGLVTVLKGTDNAQECLYMLAMAQYCNQDYEAASATFKKYFTTYPRGYYAEKAAYYVGQSLFASTPEPRLDQTPTLGAINAYQQFLDNFPESPMRQQAQDRLFALQDKLVTKEFLSAQLYYNLGSYFGNCTNGGSNYEACIVTSQNAMKQYPYSAYRERFAALIMKSKYELAEMSVAEKRLERYRDAEDECYGFINEYPDSKEVKNAEKYIKRCKKFTKE